MHGIILNRNHFKLRAALHAVIIKIPIENKNTHEKVFIFVEIDKKIEFLKIVKKKKMINFEFYYFQTCQQYL
jgi:hypothetical protein